MNNEVVSTPAAPVAATAFGEEVSSSKKRTFSLDDPGFLSEAPRTDKRLAMVFRCSLSGKGNPIFRCPDTKNGSVVVCPKGTPADLVGKVGYLTISVLPGTVFEESEKFPGIVMPSKPVNFVNFES